MLELASMLDSVCLSDQVTHNHLFPLFAERQIKFKACLVFGLQLGNKDKKKTEGNLKANLGPFSFDQIFVG